MNSQSLFRVLAATGLSFAEVLGITCVRPGGVCPARMAYEVPVTTASSEGLLVQELVYVDALDGAVLLRVPLD